MEWVWLGIAAIIIIGSVCLIRAAMRTPLSNNSDDLIIEMIKEEWRKEGKL
jgi:hypothetical protein